MHGINFSRWWFAKGCKSPVWGGRLLRLISSTRREIAAYQIWNAALDSVFTDWQPIETAPESEFVLVAYRAPFASAPSVETATRVRGIWKNAAGEMLISEPRYWMSLPKAPEGV